MTRHDVQRARHIHVRRARADDGPRLREIARSSKGHWGYPPERVAEWAAGLDLSPAALRKKEFYVAEVAGSVVGWSSLIPRGEVCWFDDLWIDPAWIGQGVGTRMFRHAVGRAQEVGASRIELEAERHALGFYKKMGARYIRDSEPGVWGRTNAVVAIAIAQPPRGE
jgi:GNAT superfamily N-acetyltransferase